MAEKVLLYQLDGKLPNVALMRIAQHHRHRGDEVELRDGAVDRQLWDSGDERVYGSLIFANKRWRAEELQRIWPQAILGGSGWDATITLEQYGMKSLNQDYSLYPKFRQSIGFTQRGCRLRCPFCVVPQAEGSVWTVQGIWTLWRGDPWPRELILLDNDFFGQAQWLRRLDEMVDGDFKVNFTQGINARSLTDEQAEALAAVDYRGSNMKTRRLYTAWDNRADETRFFAGLLRLLKYGVKPDHIMVYMLIGYWPGETVQDWLYRQAKLRAVGCRPYPMPYRRTREAVGFQRWVVGAYDKRISWEVWEDAKYQPSNLVDLCE